VSITSGEDQDGEGHKVGIRAWEDQGQVSR
jgi:hypothetical protein